MNPSKSPHNQTSPNYTPLVGHMSPHVARRDTSYSYHDENAWKTHLAQSDRHNVNVRPAHRSQANGLIDKVSNARGQPEFYSELHAANWQRRFKTSKVNSLPGPADPQGSITFNRVGAPTLNAHEWRDEQRLRDIPVAPLNAAQIKNSKRDQEDRSRMGLPQQFERCFESSSLRNTSLGTLGFGSMNLAIWEQILLLFGLALPNGGTGGILMMFILIAVGYSLVTISLADMARRYPTYAGPFYWTAALQTSTFKVARNASDLPHQMSWLCAWMSVFGLGINLVINMIFTSDVAIFLFSMAGKGKKFIYHSQEPMNRLRVPWALPVTIAVATFVALFANWTSARHLPSMHKWFAISHWVGFLIFMITIPVICHKTTGIRFTV